MKPLPLEIREAKHAVKSKNLVRPSKSSQYKSNFKAGVNLTKEQQKAKLLARRLEQYAIQKKPSSPREMTNLIDGVRSSVLELNFKKSQLAKSTTKNSKRRHSPGNNNHPRAN